MKCLLLSVLVVSLVGILIIPNAFAENVPVWVKNTAGWWATDAISETEFVNAVEFLVKENIILVNVSQTSETSQSVPDWVKNTAGWWAIDAISETEFVNAIAYLIKVGIISIESSKSPELIAEMWINGHINDDEFLTSIEHLIETKNMVISDSSVAKTSQLPSWLVNNAGWWAARIFTNSDFDFDPGYVKKKIHPCDDDQHTNCPERTFNSLGFRGNEFEKEKPDNTFRIFTVGGSTTEGDTAEDDETWPAYLQQIINEKITGKKTEVLNFGISGATTKSEYGLIKNKLLSFEPDLIIMFDGWNDSKDTNVKTTIQNWKFICKLGKNEGFDTIIIVQPLVSTGHRVLTEQEIANSFLNLPYLQKFPQYVNAFEELDKVCSKTVDFRRIFDYVQEPIFYDYGHTGPLGNQIIAENVFSVISPIYFGKTYSVIHNNLNSDNNEPETVVVYAVGADLSDRNFDNLNLQNAVFDKANLSNTSFKNTNIDGARFVFANLNNSNLLDLIDFSNINLAGADLSNVSLTGKDLSGVNLSYVDLSEHDLTGTNLIGVNLSHAEVSKESLTGKDLSGVNLSYVDLSEHDLTGTNLSDSILLRTNLSGMDLRSTTLTNADFRYANLSESNLPDSLLNNNFDNAILKNINLAGKDLSKSNFQYASFDNANLQNANLSKARFVQVDLTKIKNKSLAGADLTSTSFAHSNLSGVSLDSVILHATNFWVADLSGQDFTAISEATSLGTTFIDANLSNSNFEGVIMSTQEQHFHVLENKAYLAHDLSSLSVEEHMSLVRNLPAGKMVGGQILIISTEARGNDLIVYYVFFNNFAYANLENANFKNTILWHANFYSTNLANADLSGADLRNAYFGNADLSNANLSGANLDGANLNCLNHPICDSG